MNEAIAMSYLLFCSRWDYKWKSIPVWVLAAGMALGFVLSAGEALYYGNWDWEKSLMGLIPGMCVSVMAFLSPDQIGLGDGLVLLVIGWILGFRLTIFSAVIGLFVATVFGIGLVVVKKTSFQTAVPFIPFLAVGLGVAMTIV